MTEFKIIMDGQRYFEIPISKPIPIKKSSKESDFDNNRRNHGIFFFKDNKKFYDNTELREKQKLIFGQSLPNFKRQSTKIF